MNDMQRDHNMEGNMVLSVSLQMFTMFYQFIAVSAKKTIQLDLFYYTRPIISLSFSHDELQTDFVMHNRIQC